VFVLSGRGLCEGPIPPPEESYRLWCLSLCYQVKMNNLDTCCEQVGGRGKDYDDEDDDDDDDDVLERLLLIFAQSPQFSSGFHAMCLLQNLCL
jgi:hypothetical protein